MQEVAIVLWKKFDDSLDSQSFRRWAFGVTRMEVLAFRRDRARDRHCFGEEVAKLLEKTAEEEGDGLEAERDALKVCLEKLPSDRRDLVDAAYEPGLKMSDLAETLGWSPMALYKKLHRIRLQLVECTRREIASEGIT